MHFLTKAYTGILNTVRDTQEEPGFSVMGNFLSKGWVEFKYTIIHPFSYLLFHIVFEFIRIKLDKKVN